MRIAIFGFGAESSTFSRNRMGFDNFPIVRGQELIDLYDLTAWPDIEWLPVMRAHGGAGGPIVPEVFG